VPLLKLPYSTIMNAASLGFTNVKRCQDKPGDLDNPVDNRGTSNNGGRDCSSRILEVRHSIAGNSGRSFSDVSYRTICLAVRGKWRSFCSGSDVLTNGLVYAALISLVPVVVKTFKRES
jgi:hypothetical protein